MKFCRQDRLAQERKFADADDFRQVFFDHKESLSRLAFLLAGNAEKSEQIVAASLENSVKSTGVFKDWAENWAKHTVIQNAIGAINPRPSEDADFYVPVHLPASETLNLQAREYAMNRILDLDEFDRFVFVITVLEHYSDHDCALLLSAFFRDVRHSRIRSMREIAAETEAAFAENAPPEYLRPQMQVRVS